MLTDLQLLKKALKNATHPAVRAILTVSIRLEKEREKKKKDESERIS